MGQNSMPVCEAGIPLAYDQQCGPLCAVLALKLLCSLEQYTGRPGRHANLLRHL